MRSANHPVTDPRPREYDWRQSLLLGTLMLGAVSVAGLFLSSVMNLALAAEPGADRQKELVRFVRQECGFCHGLRLTGGLGSPLTAPALADKPAEALEATILHGRTGTAMPAWAPFLSEGETRWIVTELRKGFPQ